MGCVLKGNFFVFFVLSVVKSKLSHLPVSHRTVQIHADAQRR